MPRSLIAVAVCLVSALLMSWAVVTLAQRSPLDLPPEPTPERRQPAAKVFISGSGPSVAVNLNRLSNQLGTIINNGRKRRPAREDIPDHPDPVLLAFSGTTPFSLFSWTAGHVQNAGGTVFLSGSGTGPSTKRTRPRDLLVVSDRALSTAELGSLLSYQDDLIPALVYDLETADDLKYQKVTRSGIEIDAEGKYVAFDRTPDYGADSRRSNSNFGRNRTLEQMTFTERTIAEGSLKRAVLDQFQRRRGEMMSDARNGFVSEDRDLLVEFPVIVDASSPISSIRPLLDAAAGLRISLLVAIRH